MSQRDRHQAGQVVGGQLSPRLLQKVHLHRKGTREKWTPLTGVESVVSGSLVATARRVKSTLVRIRLTYVN